MKDTLLRICTVLMIVYFTVIISEIGAYTWHRVLAHRSIVGDLLWRLLQPMRDSHSIHHNADLKHLAKEDFFWVQLVLVLFVIFMLCVGYYVKSSLYRIFLLTITITVCMVYFYNQALHEAVHRISVNQGSMEEEEYRSKSVLGSYLCDSRDVHFVHHKLPRKNYSITHFVDVLVGTYSSGFYHTQKEVEEML